MIITWISIQFLTDIQHWVSSILFNLLNKWYFFFITFFSGTDEYDKHPNEVVKNEELTLNNHGTVMRPYRSYSNWFPLYWIPQDFLMLMCIMILVLANYYDYLHTMIQLHLPNFWWTTMLSSVASEDSVENQTFLNYLESDVILGNLMQRSNYNRYRTTSDFLKLHAFKRNNIDETDIR